MDRDNMVPGSQPRAGTGTDGQELGLAATTPAAERSFDTFGGDADGDTSLKDRGADMVERGREKVADAVDSGREHVEDAFDSGRERAGSALDSGKSKLADGISRIGERLDERATRLEEQGAFGGRAGRYVQRASDVAEDSAEYLRSHDLDVIGDDIVGQIRSRPLLSVGIALGAGFMLGSAGSRSRGERSRDDYDDDRHERGSGSDRDEDEAESGVRAQLGRAVVSGIATLLTREIHARVSGRNR